MHELAVCRALLRRVEAVARAHGAPAVTCVRVRVGPLSGVVPELLRAAFRVARAGTLAATAALEVEEAPLEVACEDCGTRGAAPAPNRLLCPACGGGRTRLASGDELLLTGMTLVGRTEEAGTGV